MMSNNQPLVSISIPVFKCEDFIKRCLESAIDQTYKNIEIVLVNDCTPDGSIPIIEQIIKENPTISIRLIHHETNQGLSVVRNTGIDNSKGKYIYFLDSDDTISNDCIEKLVVNVLETNVQMVLAQNRWINTFDNSINDYGFPTNSKEKYIKGNKKIFEAYCNEDFPVTSWNKLIELDFVKENKLYFIPGLFAQDELWMFHVMEKIDTISIIDDITYDYYLHGASVIFNRKKKNFENHLTILSYFEKSYLATDSKIRKQLIKRKSVEFKALVLMMQWRALKGDVEYLKTNYSRMKKIIPFKFLDYFNSFYSFNIKKKAIQQNLPTDIGTKIFIKKYG